MKKVLLVGIVGVLLSALGGTDIQDALENEPLSLTAGGDDFFEGRGFDDWWSETYDWLGQEQGGPNGGPCLKSPNFGRDTLGDEWFDEDSAVCASTSGRGVLKFSWKVSGKEYFHDGSLWLAIVVDDEVLMVCGKKADTDGCGACDYRIVCDYSVQEWQTVTVPIREAGEHEIRWYFGNGDWNDMQTGEDCQYGCYDVHAFLADLSWSPAVDEARVTFSACGGTVSPTQKTVATTGAYGSLPRPVRAGYEFTGWREGSLKGEDVDEDSQAPLVDTTLYAGWKTDLATALNESGLKGSAFKTDGSPTWFGETVVAADETGAVQSGAIGDGGQTSFAVTIPGAARVSFKWRVSSEEHYDRLTLSVNGIERKEISGVTDWETVDLALVDPVNTIAWTYSKDGSASSGQDCGWVDCLLVSSLAPCADFYVWANDCAHFSAWLTGCASPMQANYSARIAGDPRDCEARILHAFSVLVALAEDKELVKLMGQFGFSPIYSCLRIGGTANLTGAPLPDVAVDRIAERILPAVNAALDDLESIPTDWTGDIRLTKREIPALDEPIAVDRADVALAKSALYAAKAMIEFAQGYHWTVDYAKIMDDLESRPKFIDGPGVELRPRPEQQLADGLRPLVTVSGHSAALTLRIRASVEYWANFSNHREYWGSSCQGCCDRSEPSWHVDPAHLEIDGSLIDPRDKKGISVHLSLSEGTNGYFEFHSRRLHEAEDDDCWWEGNIFSSRIDGDTLVCEIRREGLNAKWDDLLSQATVDDLQLKWDMTDAEEPAQHYNAVDQSFGNVTALMAKHPQFFTVRNLSALGRARTDLKESFMLIQDADYDITSRKGGQMHGFECDPADADVWARMRGQVDLALRSLDGPVCLDGTGYQDLLGSDDFGLGWRHEVYLGALFDGTVARTLAPQFYGDGYLPVPGTLPDATFGGLLPRKTQTFWENNVLTLFYDPLTTLNGAVDNLALVFADDRLHPWLVDGQVRAHGVSSLRSGNHENASSATLKTTVAGPGKVSFLWAASCEDDGAVPTALYDHGEFLVDGQTVSVIDGVTGWQSVELDLGSGTHTLSWRYVKDDRWSSGDDCIWIDAVRFEAASKPIDPPVPEVLYPEDNRQIGEGETPYAAAAAVYDGFLRDANGRIVGSIQVKVAKGKFDRKTQVFSAKVTATAQLADGSRKIAFKGGVADEFGNVKNLTAAGHSLDITLGVNGLSGSMDGMRIDGARNLFSSKLKEEKSAADDIVNDLGGTYNIVAEDGILSVSVAKKGKTKVSGTWQGAKVNVSTQLLIGESVCIVPVIYAKKGVALAFNLNIADRDRVSVTGIPVTAVGRPGTLAHGAKFGMGDGAAKLAAALADKGTLYTTYLPDCVVAQNGTKWVVAPDASGKAAKAGKVAFKKKSTEIDEAKLGDNPSGLKLTYKPKDGSFTGSFKAYTLVNNKIKSYTVNVTGVMVGDKGYGVATVEKNVIGELKVK